MIKSKFISIILVLAMILCSVTAYAEPAGDDTDVLTDSFDDYIVLGANSTEPKSTVDTENGNYGKSESDKICIFTNSCENSEIRIAPSLPWNNKSTTFAGNAGIGSISFSFCLPENSGGFSISSSSFWLDNAEKKGMPYSFSITGNGISYNSKNFLPEGIKYNTWYNLGINVSSDGSSDVMSIYLNGKNIGNPTIGSSIKPYGFRTAIIKANNKDDILYLDNIWAGETFDASKNLPCDPDGKNFSMRDGKLLALNGSSVSDITLPEGDTLRLYKADWSEAASLAEADIAVFAAKNGSSIERTLTYYDVDFSDCVIDYNITEADEISALNASVYSTTEASLILAYYTVSDGIKTLEGVTSIPAAAVNGVYQADITAVTINPAYSYVLYAWSDTDDAITPLATDITIN